MKIPKFFEISREQTQKFFVVHSIVCFCFILNGQINDNASKHWHDLWFYLVSSSSALSFSVVVVFFSFKTLNKYFWWVFHTPFLFIIIFQSTRNAMDRCHSFSIRLCAHARTGILTFNSWTLDETHKKQAIQKMHYWTKSSKVYDHEPVEQKSL